MNPLTEVLDSMLEDPTVVVLYGAEIQQALREWKCISAKRRPGCTVSQQTILTAQRRGVTLVIRLDQERCVTGETAKAVVDGCVVYVGTAGNVRHWCQQSHIQITEELRVENIWPEGEF